MYREEKDGNWLIIVRKLFPDRNRVQRKIVLWENHLYEGSTTTMQYYFIYCLEIICKIRCFTCCMFHERNVLFSCDCIGFLLNDRAWRLATYSIFQHIWFNAQSLTISKMMVLSFLFILGVWEHAFHAHYCLLTLP